MSKTTKEILVEARALITDPDNWTTGCFARDDDGKEVGALSEAAACWCAWGAMKASARNYVGTNHSAVLALKEAIGHCGVASFNDGSYHHEVLEAFDKAIENCKE